MAQQPKPQQGLKFTQLSRLARVRAHEYTLKNLFKYGYRNKEDVSNLPPMTLVIGSQNVLTNAAERIGIRQGYTLDGVAGNQNDYGIDSAYDFLSKAIGILNLRKWGTHLEVRYVNPTDSTTTWIDLGITLDATKVVNFTNFWDFSTEVSMFCLFVNGSGTIYEWSGGVGSYSSSTNGGTIFIVGNNASLTSAGGLTGTSPFTYVTNSLVGTSLKELITFSTNPSDSQTLILNLNGANQTITFVSSIGVTTGNVLIGATLADTLTNLMGLINHPGTTNATQVAFTGTDLTNVGYLTSSVGNTLTVQGTESTAKRGFYHVASNNAKFKVMIDGTEYTYTDVLNETFVGVTPDPTGAGIVAGDAVIQSVASVGAGSISSLPSTFIFDLIATLDNQVWYGQLDDAVIYVSQTNDYQSVAYTAAQRLPGEGALINLDAAPIGFSAQNSTMYITAGRNEWWISQKLTNTVVISTVATETEILYASKLKLTFNQAAQSQALIGNFKNSIVFISNEPIVNTLGLVENIQIQPQMTNISDPIKYDMDAYDFTGGHIVYDNYYIYVSIPANSVVRMFNVQKNYWEAPQVMPVGCFYHTDDGTLHGHSPLTNESYKLFDGYSDNGNPINGVAAFPYVSIEGGQSSQKKSFNKLYTEGYMSANTTLGVTINYDFGGFTASYNGTISGTDSRVMFNRITDGSIGQNTLGSQPIGTILNLSQGVTNPKFRKINTFPRQNCFEYQIVYSSDDTDFQWEILRFGLAIGGSTDIPVEITS